MKNFNQISSLLEENNIKFMDYNLKNKNFVFFE